MTLNLEVSEYIPDLDLGAGARILVHDQYTMPFVDTDGVSLSPATETSIGVKKVMRFEIYTQIKTNIMIFIIFKILRFNLSCLYIPKFFYLAFFSKACFELKSCFLAYL